MAINVRNSENHTIPQITQRTWKARSYSGGLNLHWAEIGETLGMQVTFPTFSHTWFLAVCYGEIPCDRPIFHPSQDMKSTRNITSPKSDSFHHSNSGKSVEHECHPATDIRLCQVSSMFSRVRHICFTVSDIPLENIILRVLPSSVWENFRMPIIFNSISARGDKHRQNLNWKRSALSTWNVIFRFPPLCEDRFEWLLPNLTRAPLAVHLCRTDAISMSQS
jgi:hypothetical protein